ncbi:MAG: RagB/SusD family nutrient uptake outer membrane protein [Candidatus Halalkalibacterium sp. M3_1C_030]
MKYLKYILTIFVAVSFSACDLLEEQSPQQSIAFPGQLETASQVNNTLIGAYNDVQDGAFTGSQTLVFNEILADNTRWTGSFPTYVQISDKSMDPTNGSVEGVWNNGYDALNTINIILASLENIDDPTLESDRIEGEAKFLRAFAHFELVKLFAASPYVAGATNDQLGVPIKTSPVTGSDQFEQPSRNTVEEVYSAVITDLQDAINLMPASSPNGQANSWVAKALLSRVYMTQGEYASARDLAQDVVNNGPYNLNGDVLTFFRNEFSQEGIWEIAHTLNDNPGVNQALPAFYAEGARDDIQLSADFVSAADGIITSDQESELAANNQTAEDTRFTDLISVDGLANANNETNSTKYEKAANTDDNAPILRLPEMMFNYMEAQTRLAASIATVPQDVFDQLNAIRTRAIIVRDSNGNAVSDESAVEYDRTDFTNKQELLDAILLERRIELAFEGQRLTDLQRLQQDITGLPYDDPSIAFPIPQDEMDANQNITQNPAYQ